MCHGNQHRIRTPTVRAGSYLFYKLTTGWVKRLQGAEREAFLAALWNWITGIQLSLFQLADHEQLQPDGAAPEDQDGLSLYDARLLNGFHNGVDGLDEGCFFEASIVRERNNAAFCDPRHGFHVFGEAAAIRSQARRKAGRFVLLAL